LIYPIGCIPASIFAGFLKEKIGFRIPVFAAILLWAIAVILLPLASLGIEVICIIFLLGFGFQLYWNPTMLTIITKFHPTIRGRLLGTFNMMSFLAASIGPFVFGLAADLSFSTFFLLMELVLVVPLAISVSFFLRMKD
jgi:MFS family permease